MQLISKISIKTIFGQIKANTIPDSGSTAIARIYGVATKTKTGMSDNGDWTVLIGDFEAVNVITGESFNSNKAFLPTAAQSSVEVALDTTNKPVEFAFEICVVKDDTNEYGYKFEVNTLHAPNQKDVLSKLRDVAKVDKKTTAKAAANK